MAEPVERSVLAGERGVQTTEKVGVRNYRFCTRAPDGSISASCEMEVHSDEEARQIAYNLVMHEAFENMEVWRGNTQIYSLTDADRKSLLHEK